MRDESAYISPSILEFGVLLNENSELAELFLAVCEREGIPGIVAGSKSNVDLQGNIGG